MITPKILDRLLIRAQVRVVATKMNATPQEARQDNIPDPDRPEFEGGLKMATHQPKKMNNNLLLLTLSTIMSISGCQSLDHDQSSVQDKLETRKQIVINSLDSGNAGQALKEVRPLLDEYPNNAEILNLNGLIQLAINNNNKAIEVMEKAHSLQPENITFVLNLSSAYIQGHHYAKGTKILKETIASEAVKSYRYRERLFHNLGLIAELSGDSIRSERWYGRALEENPTNFLTLLRMARIYETTHRSRLALDQLETAKGACIRCVEPIEGMIRILLKQKKISTAKALLAGYEKNESLTDDDTRRIVEMKNMIAKFQAPVMR